MIKVLFLVGFLRLLFPVLGQELLPGSNLEGVNQIDYFMNLYRDGQLGRDDDLEIPGMNVTTSMLNGLIKRMGRDDDEQVYRVGVDREGNISLTYVENKAFFPEFADYENFLFELNDDKRTLPKRIKWGGRGQRSTHYGIIVDLSPSNNKIFDGVRILSGQEQTRSHNGVIIFKSQYKAGVTLAFNLH